MHYAPPSANAQKNLLADLPAHSACINFRFLSSPHIFRYSLPPWNIHPPAARRRGRSQSRVKQPPPGRSWNSLSGLWHRKTTVIAALSVAAILLHLVLRFGFHTTPGTYQIPLLATLALGGLPLLYDLLRKLLKREFGSDLLGGISIITSVLLGEYLAGSIIVLMLSGGEALENYALRSASSVLAALAKRMPSIAHRKRGSEILDVALEEIAVGDTLVIYPHDICPVDGVVIEGHGVMDESYLTGEPFQITKTSRLDGDLGRDQWRIGADHPHDPARRPIRATRRSWKSCASPRQSGRSLRRLGDQLGAIYTPVALAVALLAWAISGEADSLPRGAGDRHALPSAASRSRSPSSARFPSAPAGRSSSRAPSCSSKSPSVGPRFSTRPGRSPMASRS